ncbi:MAG: DNA polymerase IV [Clostridia bacterium]|nr:DNA polymerase IV [Clostridia bacterium]
MDRVILHCDCNAFYASVECLDRPELKEAPMAVGGSEELRHGIILAKNELAKAMGVKTAETIWKAKKKCPNLVVVAPHHDKYAEYSKILNSIYQRFTDLVEPFGIDESYLDVTASEKLFGSGREIADAIREAVKKETGLTVSVGVSFCKVFAKLGSDYKKPDATTVIERSLVEEIVYPLDVGELLFVGKKTREALASIGVRTIGSLAACDPDILVHLLGKAGKTLSDYARGLDDEPVASVSDSREAKTVGNGTTFPRDLTALDEVHSAIVALSEEVAQRLRAYNKKCRSVTLTVRNADFVTINRQTTLSAPTFLARDIAFEATEIFKRFVVQGTKVRMLTVTAGSLTDADSAEGQISLFDANSLVQKKREILECTMDEVNKKLGQSSIHYGSRRKNALSDGQENKL